ncbi:hypothetical protein [Micromonospora sp. NPDC003776]
MQGTIDAALRRQRTTMLAALAVGLAAGLLSRWATAVHSPLSLLGLIAPLIVIVVAVRELLHRPGTAELQVDERRQAFLAPPRTGLAFTPVLAGWLAYVAVGESTLLPLAVLLAAVLLLLVVVYWRRVPLVALTPEGITTGAPRGVVVPWDALDPSAVVPAGGGSLRLPVVRPDLVRGGRRGRDRISLPTRELAVAPALLAAAIAYYTAHPEHRAGIGTAAEYGRFRRELAGEPPAGQA